MYFPIMNFRQPFLSAGRAYKHPDPLRRKKKRPETADEAAARAGRVEQYLSGLSATWHPLAKCSYLNLPGPKIKAKHKRGRNRTNYAKPG
jgi:hypothetical protein